MRLRRKKRVVLALGAGGARGLAHIGVIRALKESEIPIDYIVGVSFGSIVGALFSVYSDIDEVEKKLKEYLASPMFKETQREMNIRENDKALSFLEKIQETIKKGYFYTMALRRKSLVTPEEFVMNMQELVGNLSFADTGIPFKCLSVDLITGNPIVFTRGDLLTALQASSATPGFFPPVSKHGMLLVDGGVAEMVPCNLAKTCNPDYIIAVDVTSSIRPINDPEEEIHHSLDVVFRSYDITRDFMNIYVVKEIDMVIRPDIGSYSWTDFEYFDTYVEQGYQAAGNKLEQIRKDIFYIDI